MPKLLRKRPITIAITILFFDYLSVALCTILFYFFTIWRIVSKRSKSIRLDNQLRLTVLLEPTTDKTKHPYAVFLSSNLGIVINSKILGWPNGFNSLAKLENPILQLFFITRLRIYSKPSWLSARGKREFSARMNEMKTDGPPVGLVAVVLIALRSHLSAKSWIWHDFRPCVSPANTQVHRTKNPEGEVGEALRLGDCRLSAGISMIEYILGVFEVETWRSLASPVLEGPFNGFFTDTAGFGLFFSPHQAEM